MVTSEDHDLGALEGKLGVKFNNRELLRSARTHDAYLNEPQGKDLESYERLEFLGDAGSPTGGVRASIPKDSRT